MLAFEHSAGHDAPDAVGATRGIGWIEVAGDTSRPKRSLGAIELPVRLVDDELAVRALGIGERELRTR